MPSFMSADGDRIVGGQRASSMIPWQVVLQLDGSHLCGGAILDSCTILTAAHCLGFNLHRYSIRAGSLNKWKGGQVSFQLFSSRLHTFNFGFLNIRSEPSLRSTCMKITIPKHMKMILQF